MAKLLLVLFLFLTPFRVVWAKSFVMPSGRVFEEHISFHRTLSGVLVTVSEWKEVFAGGVIKKANASEDSLEETIKNYIRTMAMFYGVDAWFMEQLAKCESGFDPNISGDKGKALGLYQWWEHSWKHYNKIYGLSLDRKNWVDQVKLSTQVVSDYGSEKDWYNCSMFIKLGTWDRKKWK